MGQPTILVTGFQPFGGLASNPSYDALAQIPDRIGSAVLVRLEVPVVYAIAIDIVRSAIESIHPAAVVMVGQAAGRAQLTVERIAINIDDSTDADNAGDVRTDVPIDPAGPTAYFSTLPIRAMVERSCAVGVPAEISNTAGTYVCNHLMYGILDHCAHEHLMIPAGFVHVPLTPEQVQSYPQLAGQPTMELSDIACGLAAMLDAVAIDM